MQNEDQGAISAMKPHASSFVLEDGEGSFDVESSVPLSDPRRQAAPASGAPQTPVASEDNLVEALHQIQENKACIANAEQLLRVDRTPSPVTEGCMQSQGF